MVIIIIVEIVYHTSNITRRLVELIDVLRQRLVYVLCYLNAFKERVIIFIVVMFL